MPRITIEVRRSWSAEGEAELMDAVFEALVSAFRIPPRDKHDSSSISRIAAWCHRGRAAIDVDLGFDVNV